MSKQRKEQQKKKKREKVRKERLGKYREMLASRGRDDGFTEHINDLLKQNDYKTAREMLLEYIERYPKITRPYWLLSKVCAGLEDGVGAFWAAEQLLEVGERDYENYLLYRAACTQNRMPATLIDCDEQMQRRFRLPSLQLPGEEINFAAMRVELLAAFKNDCVLGGDDITPYSDEQLLDLLQRQEKATLYLSSQRFDLAIRHCDKLIVRYPFFRSAYNNKALAVMLDQGPDAAEPFLQQAFEHHPDNLFAIAFKIRQLALLGRYEELPGYCERLAAVPQIFPNKHDFFTGKIEAFAWADDLERIIETYQLVLEEYGDEGWDLNHPPCAQAMHHAAVAYARVGDSESAIELWESIPRGTLDIVDENLADIQNPIGEQNGPWFFEYGQWLPKQLFDTIRKESKQYPKQEHTDKEERMKLIAEHIKPILTKAFIELPSLGGTLVDMLKRGGEDSRNWVRLCLEHCPAEELKSAVLDFIAGQAGSDECRNDFVMTCSRFGWLPSNTVQFWLEGAETTMQVSNLEIYWESDEEQYPLSPDGHHKFAASTQALRDENIGKAMKLLNEINDQEPGNVSVLYNLAVCYLRLGQEDVFYARLEQLMQEFPDYLFGRVALAQRLIKQDRLEEAMELMKPLYEMTRMHGSEFKAFAGAQIFYHLAKGDVDMARKIHQNGVSVCGKTFPAWKEFQ